MRRVIQLLVASMMVAVLSAWGPLGQATSAPHSEADLEKLTLQIAADAPQLASAGTYLVQWGPSPDPALDRVEITLENYSQAAADQLVGTYGQDWVYVDTYSMAPPEPLDRFSDRSPFYGGDDVFNSSGKHCTSGANLVGNSSGTQYVLTAGHCYSKGTTVYTNDTSRQTMGSVSNRILGGGSIDAELIPSSTAGSLWGNSGTVYSVKGTIDTVLGSSVCFDGAATGENCNDTISQRDICVTYSTGQYVCHLAAAYNNNHTVCRGGDSGGPVYQKSTGVYIAGEIVARLDAHHCYYVMIGYIQSDFNVHVQTS